MIRCTYIYIYIERERYDTMYIYTYIYIIYIYIYICTHNVIYMYKVAPPCRTGPRPPTRPAAPGAV